MSIFKSLNAPISKTNDFLAFLCCSGPLEIFWCNNLHWQFVQVVNVSTHCWQRWEELLTPHIFVDWSWATYTDKGIFNSHFYCSWESVTLVTLQALVQSPPFIAFHLKHTFFLFSSYCFAFFCNTHISSYAQLTQQLTFLPSQYRLHSKTLTNLFRLTAAGTAYVEARDYFPAASEMNACRANQNDTSSRTTETEKGRHINDNLLMSETERNADTTQYLACKDNLTANHTREEDVHQKDTSRRYKKNQNKHIS